MVNKIDLSPLIAAFSDFLTSIYKKQIDDLLAVYPTKRSLNLDYTDLEKFDPELADKLIHEPDIVIESAEQAISEMHLTLPTGTGEFSPHIRFFNLPDSDILIEHIGSKNINALVSFKGVVTRRAETMHRVKVAFYRCQLCDTEFRVFVTKNFVEPKKCETCKKLALKRIDEESKFTDIQRAEVQELLERVRGGAPAAHIELLLEDDSVNTVSPGDNIEVVGIIRIRPPIKVRTKQELIYSRYLEVVHIKGLKRDFEEIEIDKEDERHILELSRNPNIEQLIVSSVAPGIYGHLEVKHALALQMFGGTKGKFMAGGMPMRDDIHILLIGDPGLAKCVGEESQIMLKDGSIVEIKNIVESVLEKDKKEDKEGFYGFSNHGVISMNLEGKTNEKKATVFWKLNAPEFLYEFETASGRKITVTPSHPFFVTEDALVEPKSAEHLDIGDFIATPHRIRIGGSLQHLPDFKHGKTNANSLTLPDYLDKNFARFLGYLIGDGYVRRTTSYEISLTNSEKEIIDDFCNILKSLGLNPLIKNKDAITSVAIVFSIDLGSILEKLGVVKNSFNKSVPLEIMKSPNDILKEFIKSYFDCEAHISKDGIAVCSASEKLLKQIQLLLLRFGILSQLHPNYTRATNAKNHKKTKYYRLVLCGVNAKLYFSNIGFTNPNKTKKKSLLPEKSNTNIDVVPGLSKILKDIRLSLGLSQFQCGIPRSTYQHFERGDRNPSYNSLRKIVDAFMRSELKTENLSVLLKLLKELSTTDIFWDRIIKKEKVSPTSEWVYDLQVNDVHNFIAGGIFVHNSRFLQSVSELAPKSIYVSGKSVSSAGLTVTAEKDELGEGGWTLKAGALVLASGGSAQIDEFDKIEEEDRAALHEAMEGQHISVAKAGIVAKFKTKTAILAAANPKYGRFDQNKNLAEQFEIPPTLLSVAYDEPILIKQNDRIKTIKIGKFIDLYYSKDEHGIPKPAEKVEVLAFDQETLKINWRPITYVFRHTYEKPLHKLTLESGREIKITPGHSVFIFRDSKIVTVPSDQLKEGDFVIIPKRLPSNTIEITEINLAHELLRLKITRGLFLHNVPMSVFSRLSKIPRHWINFKKLPLEFAHQLKNDELRYCTLKCKGGSPSGVPTFIPVSKELLRLLGYYIAEGSLFISSSRSHLLSFCFNKKETHFIEEVKNIIFTLFKQTVSILPDRNASKVNVGNRLIYHLLHDVLNVGHSAHTKKIPDIVFNVTTDLKKQFLDAWFNGDAGVTVSRELISDVLYLLLTCGIIGTVGRDEKERTALLNGRPITSHGYYKLVSPQLPRFKNRKFYSYLPLGELAKTIRMISDSNYAKAFLGLRPETKSKRRSVTERWWSEFLSARIPYRLEHLNYFTTPHSVQEYEATFGFVREGGRTFVNKWFKRGILKSERKILAKGGFQMFYSTSNGAKGALETMEFVQRFLEGDLGVARIKKIEPADSSHYVYDISVAGDENFVAGLGGILCHNSRFDLLFPIVDVLDEEKDAKLAQHILAAHMGKKTEQEQPLIDKDLLRMYIAYARRSILPQLTQPAIDKIKDFYIDLRRRSKDTGSVAITPRYLEGLVRLAEANAKMRLNATVEEKDADTAIGLMNYVMRQVMTDRATGVLDSDVVTLGKSKTEREKLQKVDTVLDIIKDHLTREDSADVEKIIKDAANYGIIEQDARKLIAELLRSGDLYEKEHGHVRLVGGRK